MFEELRIASNLLDLAVTRYLGACTAVQKSCILGDATCKFPREFITNRLNDEMNSSSNYAKRIQEANLAISSAQNHSTRMSASAPRLPPEILTHIFRDVLSGSNYQDWKSIKSLLDYPEQLSHVCSSWRRAAIDSSDLWVHIDLPMLSRLTPRAERHIARSGRLPLHIHIHNPDLLMLPDPEATTTQVDGGHFPLLASLAKRTASLYLDNFTKPVDYEGLVLGTFLENCTPGVLTCITVRPSCNLKMQQFILAQGQQLPNDILYEQGLPLSITKQHLEDIMLGLTTFQSRGIYPLWDSSAYYGLTDLCLGGKGRIAESQVVAILKSSPQLLSFEISLEIVDDLLFADEVEPVQLAEIKRLKAGSSYSMGVLLRWILPGPKPLRLILTDESGLYSLHLPRILEAQLSQFLLRSNTAGVLVEMDENHPLPVKLFSYESAHGIKELAIDFSRMGTCSSNYDIQGLASHLRVDTLYLLGLNGHFRIGDLLKLVNAPVARSIILWGFTIWEPSEWTHDQSMLPAFLDLFLGQYTEVRILSDGRNPVEDW